MRNILVIEGRQSIGGGQIITKKVCDGLSEENNISVFIPGKENAISLYLSDFSQYHYKLKEYSRGKKQVKDYFLFLYNTRKTQNINKNKATPPNNPCSAKTHEYKF